MLLSDDKTTHLSHVILDACKGSPGIRLLGEESKALREIKRVLAAELAQEEELDRKIRAKLSSYSRPIIEGSAEWDVLYRKTFEEEQRKQRKP
jgi:hypothetical protein